MAGVPVALMVPLIASLSLDTFAVSTAVGIAPIPAPMRVRFAAACVLSEAGMPLLGFTLGGIAGRIGEAADWLAVVVLLGAGLWLVREAREEDDEVAEALERAGEGRVALLAAALSVGLDELAVGLALGALRLPIVPVVAAIAAQALAASMAGLRLGAVLGARAGRRATTLLAGLALCAASVWLAALHATGHG